MADVSKVNVNSTDYNIKDSNAMHKGVDRVTAGQSIIAPIGTASTADGFAVNASGDYSHASGFHTIAASDVQHVIGKYNEEDANGTYPFIIGGGRLDTDRKNIFTVDWNGDVNAGRSNGLTNDTKLPTGADVVSYLNSNLGNVKVVYFAKVITLPNGQTTEQTVNVSLAEAVPDGYTLNGVLLLALGGFTLPYISNSNGNIGTYVFGVDIYNKTISIVNRTTAWNNYAARFILFMSKN